MSPFLLFIHIPKAAGTSLREVVDRQYGPDAVLTYYNQPTTSLLDNLGAMVETGSGKYRALIGHFRYGAHETLKCPWKYVTVLRDPVTRTISSYYQNLDEHPERLTRTDGSIMSLGDALEEMPDFFSNQQALMLTSVPTIHHLSADIVEGCKQSLINDFAVVGVSELFAETLSLMSRSLGWRPYQAGHSNVTGPRPKTPQAVRDRIRELNRWDMDLYRFARQQLEARVAQECESTCNSENLGH